ncbi:MAG: hypothetical protein IKM77_04425 [Prevotella sp.]|jgi:hypothetical protein|nr:hypothetical protein [Prevotella sp.]
MANLYSNEQKAIVVVDDIIENTTIIYKQNCLDVQHLQYDCCRKLNQAGDIYGPMEPVIINFRIKVNSALHTSVFYKFLASKSRANFSFLFNATYGDYNRLESYEDGMVVRAFVIGVKQAFSGGKEENQNSQMMLDVQALVCSTVYIGTERNIYSEFIK